VRDAVSGINFCGSETFRGDGRVTAVIARSASDYGRDTPRMRGIQYAANFRFHHSRRWNTGSSAFADADDWTMAETLQTPSFRGDAKHRARDLPRCAIAHLRSGAGAPSRNDEEWIASSLALLAMTAVRIQISNSVVRSHDFAISPHVLREFFQNIPPSEDQRAQGMPGAQRARSLACK